MDIPVEFNNRDKNDCVNYSCNGIINYNAACYANCMRNLSEYDFLLTPSPPTNKSILPFNLFKKFIHLCKNNGIIMPSCEIRGENILFIPKGNNKHLIYTTLCCYRWSENQPGMAYATVKALEENPGIDFFQAFHYGCAKRVYWTNHSFHSITNISSIYGSSNLLILPSIAIAHLFRKSPYTEKTEIISCSTEMMTANAVQNYQTKYFPKYKSECQIKNIEHLLSPLLTPLYTEKINDETIMNTIRKINDINSKT